MNIVTGFLRSKRLTFGVCYKIAKLNNWDVLNVRLVSILILFLTKSIAFTFTNPFLFITIPLFYIIYVILFFVLRKNH